MKNKSNIVINIVNTVKEGDFRCESQQSFEKVKGKLKNSMLRQTRHKKI